ncbi:MAG: 3-phosphoglycerate dehydrogenase [Flavobacteriales bacterium]|nr:3-phosphoglycerate dehydrogenase [Flavobacteriales bacterium]
MFKIQTKNKISVKGLNEFPRDTFEVSTDIKEPDALIIRSFDLHKEAIASSILAVGRAGAGGNNIPIEKCTKRGVVVFNTPGANANAVKELVLLGMLVASRDVVGGIEFAKSLKLKGAGFHTEIEKNKSKFAGNEIKGKKLGVIGLGAIGAMLANDAVNLGMKVEGYDPFISVHHAWGLSRDVKPASSLEKMLKTSDFVSLHVPLTPKTKNFLNGEKIAYLKEGGVILNFSRDGIIHEEDLLKALDTGKVGKYITDFPCSDLINHERVISIPHLGASTKEAEENCAVMIANQLMDFLLSGNIKNSVNYPDCGMECNGDFRLVVTNRNVPSMVGQITTLLAQEKLNILEMMNKSKDDFAYNIMDITGTYDKKIIDKVKKIEGVISVRYIPIKPVA